MVATAMRYRKIKNADDLIVGIFLSNCLRAEVGLSPVGPETIKDIFHDFF